MHADTGVLLIGQAGVYRVASELMLRGAGVYLPACDREGIDLITNAGARVQVKTARLGRCRQLEKRRGYHFRFSCSQRGRKHDYVRIARKYSEEVDFIVIWGIDEDRFWIVPAAIFDNRQCLILFEGVSAPLSVKMTGPHAPFAAHVYAHENRWDLLLPKQQVVTPPLAAVS
jgi:hypothetical protein